MGKTTNILDLNNRLTKVEKGNVAQNNYNSLKNRPKINGNLLTGDKTGSQLGLAEALEVGNLNALTTTDKSSCVGAINEVNGKLTKMQSVVNIDSAYNSDTDWNIVKQGNICVMSMRDLKDIPNGTTKIGTIPVGFRPEVGFYEYVYSGNTAAHLGFQIGSDGDIYIFNTTGSAISGAVYINRNVTYFTA